MSPLWHSLLAGRRWSIASLDDNGRHTDILSTPFETTISYVEITAHTEVYVSFQKCLQPAIAGNLHTHQQQQLILPFYMATTVGNVVAFKIHAFFVEMGLFARMETKENLRLKFPSFHQILGFRRCLGAEGEMKSW